MFKRTTILVTMPLIISACSSGGGSSDSESITPTAAITTDTAEQKAFTTKTFVDDSLDYTYDILDDLFPASTYSDSDKTTLISDKVRHIFKQKKHFSDTTNNNLKQTVACQSGQVELDATETSTSFSGNGSGTVTFNNCTYYSFTINGSFSYTYEYEETTPGDFETEVGSYTELSDRLTITKHVEDYRGVSVGIQTFTLLNLSHSYEYDYFENSVTSDIDYYLDSAYLGGIIKFETTISWVDTLNSYYSYNIGPFAGSATVTGANNAKSRISVVEDPDNDYPFRIEIDADGNGSYETNEVLTGIYFD